MKFHFLILFAVAVLYLAACSGENTQKTEDHYAKSGMKNVIIMIADGCGFNHIKATDYYTDGNMLQSYEKFPVSLFMSTYSLGGCYQSDSIWSGFNYPAIAPTDSAAAATAMSTGTKTVNGAAGVDSSGDKLEHIIDVFEENGRSTGIVTSVQWSHGTPAGFAAHNIDRNNYVEIANELVFTSKLEVLMGAGHPYYDGNGMKSDSIINAACYVGGIDTWNNLSAGTAGGDCDGDGIIDYWKLIEDKSDFEKYTSGSTPKRILGTAQAGETLQQGRGNFDGAVKVYGDPLNSNLPDLDIMSKAALNVLDSNSDGFFLMIEGGAVDWASHKNQTDRMIEEMISFNKAVDAVINWVETNSNWEETLLIVTGDHESGYLTGPGSGMPDIWNNVVNYGKWILPGVQWNSVAHTNHLITFYAKGANSSLFLDRALGIDSKRGEYLDNTDIALVIKRCMDTNE